jgi:ankyrin repeat protein
MLLDAGADANFAGPGWNALHIVTWIRKPGQGSNDPAPMGSGKMTSIEIVKKLAAKGADVNFRMTRQSRAGLSSLNTIGATPFMAAARTADVELMKLFVSLGADPKIPNADGTTSLMVAAGLGTRSPGEDAGTEEEAVDAVKYCLSLGLDVNAIDNNGNTAVHGAAFKHLPLVAAELLAAGAKVAVYNQKNNQGWTPLRISDGVHRGMNLRSSPTTSVVLRKHMAAAGVSTEVEPEINISGATR